MSRAALLSCSSGRCKLEEGGGVSPSIWDGVTTPLQLLPPSAQNVVAEEGALAPLLQGDKFSLELLSPGMPFKAEQIPLSPGFIGSFQKGPFLTDELLPPGPLNEDSYLPDIPWSLSSGD